MVIHFRRTLISLLKPNTERQEGYRLKAHLFLHWFLNKNFWNWERFSKYWMFSETINSIVLKFFNTSMDCYYDFKRKTKRKSIWMDLRNPWTNFKWLSITAFWMKVIDFCMLIELNVLNLAQIYSTLYYK